MQPSRTVQDSGFSLAFQPFSVLPSNMLIQESLSSAAMAHEATSAAAIKPSVSVFIASISLYAKYVKRHCSPMRSLFPGSPVSGDNKVLNTVYESLSGELCGKAIRSEERRVGKECRSLTTP